MSVSSSAKTSQSVSSNVLAIVRETSWVLFSFFLVALVFYGVLEAVFPGGEKVADSSLGQIVAAGLIYAAVFMLVVAPYLRRHGMVSLRKLLGVHKRPDRSLLWLPFVMWLLYMLVTILAALGASYIPWIDSDQAQDVGFDNLTTPFEYVVAFVALVILPPIAEELVFRGYMFGKLRARLGFVVTTIVVSVVFGLVHMQWNVGIDTAVLSVFLCYLRERTGTIWASMVLHGIKNGLAYFFLFIAPLLGLSLIQ